MYMIGVVKRAVPELIFAEYPSHQNQSRPANLRLAYLLTDGREGSMDELFVRPAHTIGNDHRAIRPVKRSERFLNVLHVPDRKMDGQGCSTFPQSFQILTFRHGRSVHGGACGNHGLADFGKRQFLLQGRSRSRLIR